MRYILIMAIESIADQTTQDIWDGTNSKAARKIPQSIWDVARRKLDMIQNAVRIDVLRIPPSNRLEALKGNLAGFYSIRVNDQYRIIFRFNNGSATDVQITDYH